MANAIEMYLEAKMSCLWLVHSSGTIALEQVNQIYKVCLKDRYRKIVSKHLIKRCF